MANGIPHLSRSVCDAEWVFCCAQRYSLTIYPNVCLHVRVNGSLHKMYQSTLRGNSTYTDNGNNVFPDVSGCENKFSARRKYRIHCSKIEISAKNMLSRVTHFLFSANFSIYRQAPVRCATPHTSDTVVILFQCLMYVLMLSANCQRQSREQNLNKKIRAGEK